MSMDNYNNLLKAVESYYGKDDIWLKLAQWTGDSATAQELAKAMRQVPGVRTIVNTKGEVIGYEYASEVFTPGQVSNKIAQAANSNVASSTTGSMGAATSTITETATEASSTAGGVATKVKVPVNAKYQTGKLALNSGLDNPGMFVMGSVIPALIATSSGIGLGQTIDSTLYNLNPDFWDANNMSSLNPETWASITNGDTSLGSNLFNMLFQINTDGTTQPYIDEDALAYMAAYYAENGAFDTQVIDKVTGSIETYAISGDVFRYDINSTNFPVPVTQKFRGDDYQALMHITPQSTSSSNVKVAWFEKSGTYEFLIATDTPPSGSFDARISKPNDYNDYYQIALQQASSYTYDGKTVYYTPTNMSFERAVNPDGRYGLVGSLPFYMSDEQTIDTKYLAWLLLYGDQESIQVGGVEGITPQPGAVLPDFSQIADKSDIAAIKQALKTQYPDIFNNSVTNTVVQPDGTVVEHTYVPVGYPQVNPDNPTQPQGNISTQAKPYYDPEENPDISDQIYELMTYVTQFQPNPDPEVQTKVPIMQPDPITDPNPPDTGEGDSPAIVIPAGSTSALFSVYNPTQAQVDSFGAWLWSSDFVDQLKKIFNDPMESIISLHKIFATPSTGASQNIYVGYLNSGVSSATVTNQYVDVDCGSITLYEYFGNVFDYENTALHLYLPFVGFVNISTYDAMRSEIKVVYHVDVLTGECLVDVEILRDLAGGVLYQYNGNCAVHYPVSAGSYIGLVGGLLSAAVGIGGSIATGGALAPALIGAGAGLMRAHTDVSRGGGFSGNSGAMGAKKPYLVITRPQTAVSEKYLEYEGIGSNHSVLLNTVQGYAKIKDVQLHDINAYRSELDEIESLLRAGIII